MSTDRPEAGAHSPGKLILSGEHSVLYGAPALAMALARYTEVWFTPIRLAGGIRTAFANLSGGATYPLKTLSAFRATLDNRFERFTRGDLPVHKILNNPDDLAVYALATSLTEQPADLNVVPGPAALDQPPAPGELGSRSDLPVGAGMGSSAAIVAAVTILFETLLDRPKTPEDRVEQVRFCERLKHGRAGPIDAASVVRGGLVRIERHQANAQALELDQGHSLVSGSGWYWVLHGRPATDTGECVSAVAEIHGQDSALWDAFASCTQTIEQSLLQDDDPSAAITENQRLLERIGVVPQSAQDFVKQVEAIGGAAKICGAGAVRGDQGGAILVRLDDKDAMTALMADHPDLSWDQLQMSRTGAGRGPAPKFTQGFDR